MSIRTKYFLFIGVLHAVLVLLVYLVLRENKWYFIASEVLILLSLLASYLLYQALIKPIELMQTGTDAIQDMDFSIKYVKTGSKEVDKLVDVFNHMIDTLRTERTKMSEQSYFVQNLLHASPAAILIENIDGTLNYVNPSARKLLDLPSNYKSVKLQDLDAPLIEQLLGAQHESPTLLRLNGTDQYRLQVTEVVHQGAKRRFLQLDDLSTELLASEKNAYGQIIRMLAHEVNNSMGAVNSILDTVAELGLAEEDQKEFYDSVQIAISRNKGLSTFMDKYASLLRLPDPMLQQVDVNALLKKVSALFTPMAAQQEVEISTSFFLPRQHIQADPVLLEQALSNIIKNAIEATTAAGQVHVRSVANGFEVLDNGVGLPEEVKAKLFTPFFSTKPTGQGVGLMLIREILSKHNMRFELGTDEETELTKFTVEF